MVVRGRARHELFGRKGRNLTITVPITFPEAALGATVTVPTLDQPVTLRIPAGTRSGRTFRVKGRGVPLTKGAGDLLVTVEVAVPEQLSDAERKAVEALASWRPKANHPDDDTWGLSNDSYDEDRQTPRRTGPCTSSRWRPSWPASTPRRCASTSARAWSTRPAPSGGSRRYSERDIDRLRRIQELTNAGLNLEGVRRVMELEQEVAYLRAELERARDDGRQAVERTHRQYRRDLVPVSQSLVWVRKPSR